MRRVWVVCIVVLAALMSASPQTKPKSKGAAHAKRLPVQDTVPAPAPVAPVAPPLPAQRPPVPARVSMANGLVTVLAENSTLTDVLNGIEKVAKIKIDSGGVVSYERVAAQIGPAPVREVLYSLLQGSRYDFVILSSLKDPAVVERVILTPRMAGSTQPTANNAPKSAQPVQEIEPLETMGSGDENEGFAPPAVTQPSPAPSNQPPPANLSPEQIRDNERNNQANPNANPQNREPRPERPR